MVKVVRVSEYQLRCLDVSGLQLAPCWSWGLAGVSALSKPCVAVTYSIRMGQTTLFTSPCHRPTASSLPVLYHCPSQLAVGHPSPMSLQPTQALGCGQLTHAGGEKRAPALLRSRGLAMLCLPPEWPVCSRGAHSCCALPVHPARHHGETPLLHLPAAWSCNCSVPADAALMALPSPDPGWPFGASLTERISSVGGLQPHKMRHWQAGGIGSENI